MSAEEMLKALAPEMQNLVVEALTRLASGEDPSDAIARIAEESARQRAFDALMTKAKG